LWETDARVPSDALPTLGSMIAEEIGGIDASETEARLERANTTLLWGESAPVPDPIREAKLQPRADRLGDRSCQTPNQARYPQHEQDDAEHHPGGGYLAGSQAIGQDDRRYRFHWLHGQR